MVDRLILPLCTLRRLAAIIMGAWLAGMVFMLVLPNAESRLGGRTASDAFTEGREGDGEGSRKRRRGRC